MRDPTNRSIGQNRYYRFEIKQNSCKKGAGGCTCTPEQGAPRVSEVRSSETSRYAFRLSDDEMTRDDETTHNAQRICNGHTRSLFALVRFACQTHNTALPRAQCGHDPQHYPHNFPSIVLIGGGGSIAGPGVLERRTRRPMLLLMMMAHGGARRHTQEGPATPIVCTAHTHSNRLID